MPYEFKAPLGVKITLGIIAAGLFSGTIIFYSNNEEKNRKAFFELGFSSVIIKSNTYYYQARFKEFHLENGLKIYLSKFGTKNLEIGDLIVKKGKTYNYAVYKKNEAGKYELFTSYNFTEVE